ncbi:MAG: ATP-dependent DNA helicase RecG, partial [Spirochaetales bacterium]
NMSFATTVKDISAPEYSDNRLEIFKKSLSPRQKLLHDRLTFSLTDDQIDVILHINYDIDAGFDTSQTDGKQSFQMARLLQGDVGSGKTLVAFFAALRIIDWGGQCALLAPTELLARQHAQNAANLLEVLIGSEGKGVQVAFLTGNIQAKGRALLLKSLKSGDIDLVIGTHALFSASVIYHNLRLVIIDEQHRFGVIQRNAIIDKGRTSLVNTENAEPVSPALLMMSATPIPQTLALTVYGDLDVSTIKTMPAGRKPIITHLTRQGNEKRVYEAVRSELQKGHQAYFVYPRIEDSQDFDDEDSLFDSQSKGLKSAEHMYDFLSQQVYPDFKCALIHSKIDEQAQSVILNDFRNNDIQVIVATSVVEVGVDVPNASCMVIEHAERFGLAALHQLRGRVGRGKAQSACFLIYSEKLSEHGKARLKVMHESTDGFFIAEEDLRLRGPGEVTGIQQSGYFTLGIADPIRDSDLLEQARKEVLAEFEQESC